MYEPSLQKKIAERPLEKRALGERERERKRERNGEREKERERERKREKERDENGACAGE